MNFKLKLAGRSGCEIGLIEKDGSPIVKKFSKSVNYNQRLILQAKKQSTFLLNKQVENLKSPKVLNHYQGDSQNLAWIEMEYIHAEKYSDYLERISVPDLNNLAVIFVGYFRKMLQLSQLKSVDSGLFIDKLDELKTRLVAKNQFDQLLLTKIFKFLERVPKYQIPVGECHGDFTFSNMMFDGSVCYLIDFLDVFVESPIQDIVKFRQDTHYHWSIMLESNLPIHTTNKLVQVMGFFDELVCREIINKEKFVSCWYQYLQLFNLLRILPYLTDQKEIDFVENALKKTI